MTPAFQTIGDQNIAHGDCLQALAHLPSDSVDLIVADLPFGVTRNRWDTCIDLPQLWTHLLRVGRRRAAFVFFATQPFTTTLINSQPRLFRYDFVWDKVQEPTGFLNARKALLRIHETGVVFYRASPTYNPQKTVGHEPYKATHGKGSTNYGRQRQTLGVSDGDRYPTSIVRIARVRAERGMHPTQKPVALLEWIVRTYSNPSDTVLDPTCGSGTTLVACRNTGRRGVGIEMDPGYFDTACARLRDTALAAPA